MGQFKIRGAPVGRAAIMLAVMASMGGFIFGMFWWFLCGS
jgi:hypothetical protein